MKIAQIVCTYPPYRGGIGNVAKKYTQLLKKKGHDVTVFTPLYKKEYLDKYDEEVKPLIPLLSYGNGAFIPSLYYKLKDMDHVILHYPFFGAAEIVWLYTLLKTKNKKITIFYHMDVVNDSLAYKILSLPSKTILSSLFSRCDTIICSSADYISNSDIGDIYKKNKSKFVEIPFGVDIERFSPRIDRKPESKKILFVGGLDKAHYFKGLNNLIHSFSNLEDKNIELTIVGDGDLKKDYEKLSVRRGCSDRVDFAGSVSDDDLVKYYQDSYILVLPSINKCEAFGLVLLEAMACGLPVVVSDLPGVRSVFENKKQGLLIKSNSVEDLTAKLNKIIQNKEMHDQMSVSARSLIEEKYSWTKIGDRLEKTIL